MSQQERTIKPANATALVLIVASLLFAFGFTAQEVVKGRTLAFDREIMLALRSTSVPYGLLDLMILPELDHAARLDAFSHLLREGAAGIRTELITARGSWIEYDAENELNVNLDGEPMLAKRLRVECRRRVLPVRLGDSPLVSSMRP